MHTGIGGEESEAAGSEEEAGPDEEEAVIDEGLEADDQVIVAAMMKPDGGVDYKTMWQGLSLKESLACPVAVSASFARVSEPYSAGSRWRTRGLAKRLSGRPWNCAGG